MYKHLFNQTNKKLRMKLDNDLTTFEQAYMKHLNKSIYEQIRRDELTNDLDMIAEVIGIDNVYKLLGELQGISFYIPKITRLDKFIARYMSENKDKSSKQIAKELRVSEIFINNFIRRQMKK